MIEAKEVPEPLSAELPAAVLIQPAKGKDKQSPNQMSLFG